MNCVFVANCEKYTISVLNKMAKCLGVIRYMWRQTISIKLEIDFVSVFYPVSFPIYVHEINISRGLYERGMSHTVNRFDLDLY